MDFKKNEAFDMPQASIVLFENEDVVTASDTYVPGENETPFIPKDA